MQALLVGALVLACQPGSEPMVGDAVALQVERPGLLDRAGVAPENARAIALERSGGGLIEEAELEEEGGLLVYEFEVRTPEGAVIEIVVDAMTGAVLGVEGEDDDEEHADDHDDDDHDDDDDHRRP